MAIIYKKLFALLEENGWTTYRIRKEKLIGQGTLTALKNGKGGLDSKTISRLCQVLECQPGDLMEYVPDEATTHEKSQNESKKQTIEPNKEKKQLSDTDLSEIDLHRLVNNTVYQIDVAEIYGMDTLADLLEKARQQSIVKTEE